MFNNQKLKQTMKKWFKKAVFTVIALVAVVFAVKAGDSTAVAAVAPTPDPTTPVEPVNPVLEFFFSYAGLVLLIQIVTGWILKTIPLMGKTLKQMTSWVVAVGIAYIGKLYGYGLFADASLVETIATGIGLGMAANYLYDAKTLESILSIFFANKKES